MKTLTTLLAIALIYIDVKYNIRNSWLFIQIGFLLMFYFGGRYATRTLVHRKRKRDALKADKGYRNPKEVKNWREYRSNVEIVKTKELDYFDKL